MGIKKGEIGDLPFFIIIFRSAFNNIFQELIDWADMLLSSASVSLWPII